MIKYRRIDPSKDGETPPGHKWICTETCRVFLKRYGRWEEIAAGTTSDGATGAFDIKSAAWWAHDNLCKRGTFQDGTPISAWQAANCLRDVLRAEGRLLRSYYWHWATFLFGCTRAKANGWFRVSNP